MGDKEKDKSKEKAKDKGKEAQAKEKDKDKNKKKKKKKQMNYFEAFIDAVELSCLAAEMLQSVLENFDRSQIESQVKELHKIEHTADLEQHVVVEKLMHEFITPIDREDINRLSHEIDAVTDAVEEVLMNVYMYRIEEITPAANEMASLIAPLKMPWKNSRIFPRPKCFMRNWWRSTIWRSRRIGSTPKQSMSYTEARTPSKCWRGIRHTTIWRAAATPASTWQTQSRAL